jgi:dimethylargininase
MADLFGFTHAIARSPGRSVVNGLRDGAGDDPVFEAVLAEHEAYVSALRSTGLEVERLAPAEPYPDSIFVEDTALVFGEGAILLKPGATSRAGEVALMVPVLDRHFDTVLTLTKGHVDGGDVLVAPGVVVIGLSNRTNWEGAEALRMLLDTLGKRAIVADTPPGILHFKTGCGMIDRETVFVAPQLADCPAFSGLRVVVTPEGEEGAANVLRVRDRLFIGDQWPKSRDLIEQHGVRTLNLSVSEIAKIDAGLSCMSLRWCAD